MSVTLQDILNETNDLLQNYTNGNIDEANKIRAINRAIEYVQRRMALPSDKRIHTFWFYQDVPFYDCPAGFNELIQLYYNNTFSNQQQGNPNYFKNRWFVVEDIQILRASGYRPEQNKVAFTTANQENQLLLHGNNITQASIIQSFDSLSGISYSADITDVSLDYNIKKQGSASMKFNIDNSLAESEIYFNGLWDIQSALNMAFAYRLYVMFPTGTTSYFSDVELRLETDSGNYYKISTTTQENGDAWVADEWSFLSFDSEDITTVGTPNSQQIQTIRIILNHSMAFQAVSNMRIDYLYQIFPDYMNALYYSAYKGSDSTGVTEKINLTELSDIAYFGDYAQDLIAPISLQAATRLFPQIRGNAEYWQMYKADFADVLKQFGKVYPRIRAVNAGQTQLIRP